MMTFDAPTLTVNLAAIVANYRLLARRFAGDAKTPKECAAVVKANAYGLGGVEVAQALAAAGCQSFFVATLDEGIELRAALPERRIAVFHGVGKGEALAFANHRLIPVLNSPDQMERWREVAADHRDATSILHIDTGMGRLGLTEDEMAKVSDEGMKTCRVGLMMSHLSSAGEPEHPENALQRERFNVACSRFADIPRSLANSSGIFLPDDWHFDLARPGCALYGITPHQLGANPMAQVAALSAPIIQIRELRRDQAVGYGATQTLPKGSRLATVAIGYADGVFRTLSHQLHGFVGEIRVPLVGRVTMDMLVFDVSTVPESQLTLDTRIILIDERQTVDDIARMTHTIGYEVFTRIGARVRRVYEGVA